MTVPRYTLNPKTHLMEPHKNGSWIEYAALERDRKARGARREDWPQETHDYIKKCYEEDEEVLPADPLSADLVRIQEHWPYLNFYSLDGKWEIENVGEDSISRITVTGDTPKEAVKAALKEIGKEGA